VKLSDGGGLQLWVQTTGSKLWNFVYRYNGQQRQMAFGPYPEVGLGEARSQRERAKKMLREGINPSQNWVAKRSPEPGSGPTFKAVALEYIEKRRRENLASATMIKKQWLLDLAYPKLGELAIEGIKPKDVLGVLQEVEERGCFETARRLRATIGAVFRYAVATARAEIDPTPVLRGAIVTPKSTPRAAITDPKKFGGLLRSIYAFDGQPTTTAGLKLMAILFPRPGELRLSKWPEFDFENRIWTIPAERTKMRREHQIPLPKQAVDVLLALKDITGHHDFLLPGLAKTHRPISENTLNLALRRMGYADTEMTSHGFRASASTMLNESGKWSSDAIERQLAHIDKNAVRRVYARGLFWDERVRMMDWWASYLDKLRNGD
jgi:integrase